MVQTKVRALTHRTVHLQVNPDAVDDLFQVAHLLRLFLHVLADELLVVVQAGGKAGGSRDLP